MDGDGWVVERKEGRGGGRGRGSKDPWSIWDDITKLPFPNPQKIKKIPKIYFNFEF